MHNLKFKKISIALCMALLPTSLFAAGLGKLNVDSGIGEPLRADIELISVSAEELASITAAIASAEAYASQGIERPASHNNIKVEIAKNSSGAPILKLKSNQPISEPFLDMLIQVDWNSGRLLREYTVLLDPPGYTGETDSASQDSQTTQLPLVKSNDMPADAVVMSTGDPTPVKKKSRKNRAKVAPETESSTEVASASGDEYMTQSGDTLGKIARNMKPEGVSLDQMLVGLFEANKEAFSGNNMNRLKVGQILRPPSEEALNAISQREASREIKVQTENWNEYRNKLAGIVADTTPADSETGTQSASGKIKPATEDKSMSAATGPKDVVKLSAGDANGSAETKSLQAKVAALQEEVVAREKGLKEAQDKTAALEKQIADMQKLLELKSGAMAEMQKQAEAATVETPKPLEPPKPIEPAATTAEPPSPVQATTDNKSPVTEKPAVQPAPAPIPVEEPSFLSGLLNVFTGQDSTLMAGAGGLLAVLGGAWFYLRNKRKKNLADFEQGIMTSGGLKANTVFGNTSGASVDTGDTSFLTDFSQSANGGMIDTNDVDPIAEAEVYMAYGRDAQAEEILKDAISKEPKRYELHLKLLEMYAASKNMSAFETVSGELYTTLGASDPTWAKVAEIGIKLEPNNPLYQVGNTPTGSTGGAEGKLDASDFSDSPLAAAADLDFSLDSEALGADAADIKGNESFDLNIDATAMDDVAEATPESIDFPQETSLAAETSDAFEMPLEMPKSEEASLDFDMGGLGETSSDEAPLDMSPGFAHTMPDLDFPKLDTAEADIGTDLSSMADTVTTFGTTVQNMAEEKFELPQVEMVSSEPVLEDSIVPSLDVESSLPDDTNNFGFDITTISPDIPSSSSVKAEANTLDLTGISLNLDESAEAPADMELAADEPAEVETKLELVAAYIEMDDKEGAKELLDEVMREGGANQRKRAEALLTQIS